MDVHEQLNHLEAVVRGAKPMPMSTSCLVNRAELLGMVERLRRAIPASFDHANALMSERDAVLASGRKQAEIIVGEARGEREQLIAQSGVLTAARERAAAMITEARAESTRLLADADGYVDRKLAEFETFLGQLGSQVNNGRLRLTTRRQADLAHFEKPAQSPSHRDDGHPDVPAESETLVDSAPVDPQGRVAADASPGTR
jgi:hypothetical protein